MNTFQTPLIQFIFPVFPQLFPQITTSHKQECGFLCSNQMLTDDRFFLLNYFSGMSKSSPPAPVAPQMTSGNVPCTFFLKSLQSSMLAPPGISSLPDFPEKSYFFSSQPSQNMRPKELQASVQDFQRPQSLVSMPTICAHTGTSDALGMCVHRQYGTQMHIFPS